MTKFADQLFDDLMREHGSALAQTRAPAPTRHTAPRRTLIAAGVGVLAAAATAGGLMASGGGAPAYALTTHPDGTVTLDVYTESGIAGINTKLHQVGDDQVVVVPVGAGCPSMSSLPAPAASPNGEHPSVQSSVSIGSSAGGSVTVNAKGIPAGDILVVAVETTRTGNTTTSLGAGKLTTAPAPSCVSLPSTAGSDFGWGSGNAGPGAGNGGAGNGGAGKS